MDYKNDKDYRPLLNYFSLKKKDLKSPAFLFNLYNPNLRTLNCGTYKIRSFIIVKKKIFLSKQS